MTNGVRSSMRSPACRSIAWSNFVTISVSMWCGQPCPHVPTEIVTKFDPAIDLHAGDLIEDLTPFVIYRETGEAALDERIRKMANAYGARWAVKSAPTGERPGSL